MIFTAPNDSPAHLALRECAPPTVSQDALRRFLCEVNAHCDLVALLLICENIPLILDAARYEWNVDISEKWGLEHWIGILEWIVGDKASISKRVGADFKAGFDENDKHPLMGRGIERYPVYAAMCNSHRIKDSNHQFRLLQAHLLIAHVLATRDHVLATEDDKEDLAEYESHSGQVELLRKRANPYPAAFAVREISETNDTGLLTALPLELPPEDEFLEKLKLVAPETTTAAGQLRALTLFFRKAIGGHKQGTRKGGGGGGGFSRRIQGGRTDIDDWGMNDFDDKEQNHSQHATVRRSKLSAEENTLLDIDDDPYGDDEEELGTSNFDKDEAFQSDPGAYQEASTAQLNHIVMANQMFPWSYGTLAVAELKELLYDRTNETQFMSASRRLSARELDQLELLALVAVMFWTASSLDRAKSLNYFGLASANRNVDLALIPASDTEIAKWRIAAPLPVYRRRQPEIPVDMDRTPKTEYLELPDVAGGSCLVSELLRQQGLIGGDTRHASDNGAERSRESARVFARHKPAWYAVEIKKLLKNAWPKDETNTLSGEIDATQPASRITKSRVSNLLFSRVLLATKGDVAAAAIITGRKMPMARVRLFYASRSVSRLQSIYFKVALGLRSELDRIAGSVPTGRPQVRPDSMGKYVSNRICPNLRTVKHAIHELMERISDYSKHSDDQGSRDYHNHYTLYTVLMFSYSTGIRGIRTPYISIAEVDQVNGIAKITDKDSGTGYKAKLTWIMPSLRLHMEHYRDFISRSPRVHEAGDKPCFFLGPEMEPIEVRPNTLPVYADKFMREFLPFPANIHRRFVSSELLDRGCPAEVVDAWMGHWHRGEEGWGPSSSFSFGKYREVLEAYLVPLLEEEIGFRPIKGDSTIRVKDE